jgi:hypothetical protein
LLCIKNGHRACSLGKHKQYLQVPSKLIPFIPSDDGQIVEGSYPSNTFEGMTLTAAVPNPHPTTDTAVPIP